VILPQIIYKDNNLLINDTYLESTNQTLDEACPLILSNNYIIIANNLEKDETLLTRCCTYDYEKHLESMVEKETGWEKFLDVIQGTVSLFSNQKSYLTTCV
jgi:hypothetical protein